jgi:hypothetical protein
MPMQELERRYARRERSGSGILRYATHFMSSCASWRGREDKSRSTSGKEGLPAWRKAGNQPRQCS